MLQKNLKFKTSIIILMLTVPPIVALLCFALTDHQSKNIKIYLEREFLLARLARNLNSYLNIYLLKHNQIGPVHLGKNNWLFTNYAHEESFHQMAGHLNLKGLESWSGYIDSGCPNPYDKTLPYYFGLIPNKETLYPEFTSFKLRTYFFKRPSVLEQVTNLATVRCPKTFVNIYAGLHVEKKHKLYHATDSHWNPHGALIAFNTLAPSIGKKKLEMNFSQSSTTEGLDNWLLIKPSALFLEETYREYNRVALDSTLTKGKDSCWSFHPGDDVSRIYKNTDQTKVGYVMLIGDSFRSEIAKYFACSYQTTVVLKRSEDKRNYEQAIAEYGRPDLIVELFIQRYMDQAYKKSQYSGSNLVFR